MPFGAIIGAGIGLLGSSMQADAASSSAAANLEAAKIAAEAQKFRPVGVTTRFGTSNFTTDANGNVIGAGYNVAPDIAALRDRLLSQAGSQGISAADQALAAQQGLFGLGSQYLATSPQAAAQDWMAKQQDLLTPARDQAYARMQQNLSNTGRAGLSMAQGGDLRMANPEAQAYYNALAQQDKQLAAEAMNQGMNQTNFGAGLFSKGTDIASAGYNPLKTMFGLGQTMETAGQGALDLGINIGGRQTQENTNAANTIYRAQTALNTANAASPFADALQNAAMNRQLTSGLGGLFSNWNNNATMLSNNALMSATPNYMDAAGQLPMLDYSNFQWD